MAKKAKKGAAKKGAAKKAVAGSMVKIMRTNHPDVRLPVWNDDTHEILCKWIEAENEYHCDKVPTGGDW